MCDVSIVIPLFNCENTIKETILSIENATFKNLEVILVDDGSTDQSVNVVENIISNSNLDMQLFVKENEGPSKTRNFGVTKAKGKFIVFIDSDDKIHPTYIEKAFHIINASSKYCLVYSDVELFGAETGKWKLKDFELSSFLIENSIPIFAMFKKEQFVALTGFDEKLHFAEDWELWIRFLKKFGTAFQIKEELYYYRKSQLNDSLTDKMNHNNKIDAARKYIYDKHYDFYCENNLSFTNFITYYHDLIHYKKKYESVFYRKLFKFLKKK